MAYPYPLLLVMLLSSLWLSQIAFISAYTNARHHIYRGIIPKSTIQTWGWRWSSALQTHARPEIVSIMRVPVCNATSEHLSEWKSFYQTQATTKDSISLPNRKPRDVQYEMRLPSSSLIGTVRIRPYPDGWVLVRGLLIASEHRQQGHATQLLDHIMHEVQEKDSLIYGDNNSDSSKHGARKECSRLFCFADKSLSLFYEKCGFVQINEEYQNENKAPAWIQTQYTTLAQKWDQGRQLSLFLQSPSTTKATETLLHPYSLDVQVVILQHHLEPKRPTATVPLLEDVPGLNATCLIWRGRIDNDAITKHLKSISSQVVLLWVGGKTEYIWHEQESNRQGCKSNSNHEEVLALNTRPSFVILDGTWQEAKTMFRKIPLLPTLPRWTLIPLQPSQYVLRRDFSGYKERMGQGRTEVLCTAEVVAEILDRQELSMPSSRTNLSSNRVCKSNYGAGHIIREKLRNFQHDYRTVGPQSLFQQKQND